MRAFNTLCSTLLLLSPPTVDAHGRLETLTAGGKTVFTRKGPGYESDPVGSRTASTFVCRHPQKTPDIEITAGGKFELQWMFGAAHLGDCALFMSYDNANFFKIGNFPECNLDNKQKVPVNVPNWLPNGQAVVRWDWYALHTFPSVEFYSQCIDVTVTGSDGTKTVAQLAEESYSVISPPIYPANGQGGGFRNGFDRSAPWFMTGPDCIKGITGNCCDVSDYAYGKRYSDCANTGTSTGGATGEGTGGAAGGTSSKRKFTICVNVSKMVKIICL
jgi:hypothetical protein